MRTFRNLRMAEVIRSELGKMLARDFEFPGFVTITDVEVTSDLSLAKIKLGIIPPEQGPAVYNELTQKAKYIRGDLLRKMNVRPMPDLEFVIDEETVRPLSN